MAEVSLHILVSESEGLRRIDVTESPFTIGRSSDNHLKLGADNQVSRQQAELIRERDVWYVSDRGSRSGTFLNGERIERAPIRPGDRLRVGMTELQIVSPEDGTHSGSTPSFDFRQVNALLKGLRGLGSSAILEEVLALVLDSALDMTGAERGFILLADAENKLTPMLARAQGGVTLAATKTSGRIPDQVFLTGEDRIVTDLRDDPDASAHEGTIALGIRHVLCTPLNAVQYGTGASGRIGVLYLDSRERGYLQHAAALHVLAAEAAVVIENARLYREVVEKEREAQELKIAAGIQRALLPPRSHTSAHAELTADSVPCLAVGGDLFDYAEDQAGRLTFTVADVAGKGTAAALLTAVMQGLLTAEAGTGDPPRDVVDRVNRALCRRAIDGRFVTAFYGVLAGDGTLQYCNAGHNPPLLLSADGVRRLDATGCPLGLFDSAPYEQGQAPIAPNDLLVLYSDGVTEATNTAMEEFGDERLLACLEAVRDRPCAEVLEAVQQAVREFTGTAPVQDDITVMVLRTH